MKKIFFLYLFLILIFRFQIVFLEYISFLNHKTLDVKVINQYKKNNYFVLKLKNRDVMFYTISREYLKNILNDNLKVNLITKNVSFWDFLNQPFFVVTYNLKLEPLNFLEIEIEKQHKNEKISNLFKALFLGEAMDFSTRKELSALGISYLFALSGLHLGFISLIIYVLLYPIYNFFHKKFPYRNRYVDIGIIALVIEGIYLYYTQFPPSLIRAYVLEIILFVLALRLQKIISVWALVVTFFVSFILFPLKIFNFGFFLSIVGVYYIYLFFRHFGFSFFKALVLPFYMFIVMFVYSHSFFPEMSHFQLFSPIVNLIFPFFYFLEIFLHLIGYGGILDGAILKFLSLGDNFYNFKVSLWFLALYLFLSILSYRKKSLFYGINILGVIIILASL